MYIALLYLLLADCRSFGSVTSTRLVVPIFVNELSNFGDDASGHGFGIMWNSGYDIMIWPSYFEECDETKILTCLLISHENRLKCGKLTLILNYENLCGPVGRERNC